MFGIAGFGKKGYFIATQGKDRKLKYNNRKCRYGNIIFDSLLERDRYLVLKERLLQNKIQELKVHPIFINSIRICGVEMDFEYVEDNKTVMEDVKGFDTDISKLKRKMFEACYKRKVRIIKKHNVTA